MNGDLSLARSEYKAFHADDIAYVPLFELGKGIGTYIV